MAESITISAIKAATRRLRGKLRPKPIPDLKLAGIYNICGPLELPKWGEPKHDRSQRILVDMKSGATAIYAYREFEPAWDVDWGWHVYSFERYLRDGETISLRHYSPGGRAWKT